MARFLVELLINASGEPQVKAVFDNIGAAASTSSKSVDAASLRTEASLRRTAEAAQKLKEQMADTKAAKGFIADMTALNTRLDAQIKALRAGPEAMARYTQEQRESAEAQRILNAQVRAGVSAESAQGKQIAEQIKLHNRLQAELDETRKKQAALLMQKLGTGGPGGTDQASALLGGISSLLGGGGPLLSGAQNLLFFKATLDGVSTSAGGVAGGITAIVSSLGPYLPLAAAAVAVTATLGVAFKGFDYLKNVIIEGTETQVVIEQLNNSLRSNGSYSGLSSAAMIELAESLALLSGQSDDAILAGELMSSRYEKIGKDIFPRVATAAVNMSRALPNKSVEESFSIINRAVAEGGRGLNGLKEAGIALLPSQKAYLTQMLEMGRVTEHQNTVLTILEEKLGNAAEAYGSTMPGAVDKSKFVYGEFRESIASEVIPALEHLLKELIDSAGGWDFLLKVSVSAGHEIGNSIRLMVYGAILLFQEYRMNIGTVAIATLQAAKFITDAMAALPGAGAAWTAASIALDKKTDIAVKKQLDLAGSHLRTIAALREHRQALEGNTEVYDANGSAIEDVGRKTKATADLMAEWDKILFSLSNHILDQTQKLVSSISGQDALILSLRDGIEAYELQIQVQSRAAAVKQALAEADRSFRGEQEELLGVIEKLNAEGRRGEAGQKAVELERVRKAYEGQRKVIGELAGAEFDRKQQVKDTIGVIRESTAADEALRRVQAELQDMLAGTTSATRALAREQAIRVAGERAAQTADREGVEIAKDRAAADFDRVDAEKALLAIERIRKSARLDVADARDTVADWTAQREAALRYGEAIAGILTQFDLLSDAAHRRAIEERVASAVAAGASEEQAAALRRELLAQQAIIDGLHRMQAELLIRERWYRDLADQLSSEFSRVFDRFLETGEIKLSDFGDAVKNAFRSTTSAVVNEWLQKWFQAMAAWLVRWIATQAAARAASAAMGSSSAGGASALFGMGAQAAGAGALGAGGAGAGGGMLSGVKGLFGGTGTFGATGASLAWMGVFVAAVAALLNQQKTSGRAEVDTTLSFGGGKGIAIDEEMSRWNRQGGLGRFRAQLKAMEEMIKAVTSFIQGAGGAIDQTIKSTSSITVGREGQGGKTNWFVKYADGLVKHFGKDMEAAMSFAMVQAIKQAPTLGLSPEVASAIAKSGAESMEQLQKDIDLAMSIVRDRLGSVGSDVYDKIKAFYSRVEEAAKLGITIDESVLAGQLGAIRNQLLGINTAVADFLASLLDFQEGIEEGSRAMQATLRARIKETEEKLADLIASGPKTWEGPSGEIRTQSQEAWEREIQRLRDAIAKYLLELEKIPDALSDQEINMGIFNALYEYLRGSKKYADEAQKYARIKVELEFAAIKAQLIALGKWEEFAEMFLDAYNAAKNEAGRAGRKGGSGKADEREGLRDTLVGLRAEAAGPLHVALLNLDQEIGDFTERAKKAKLPAKELAEAIDLMTQRFQRSLRTQAESLAGLGTDFTKKLQEVSRFFAELRELGRKETGMPNWLVNLLEGKALGKLGAELDAALNQFMGLIDPMAAINAQADTLRQNVIAYGQAAGWTAEQIEEALKKVDVGVGYQRERAIGGIMGTLFGYLKDNEKYAGQYAEFKKQEVELEFRLIEAQLKALGAWDEKTQEIFYAAKEAALAMEGAAKEIATTYQKRERHISEEAREKLESAINDAVERWRSGIAQFTEQTRALMLNPNLTGLTQAQRYETAKTSFESLLAKAQGGDTEALSQLDQARSAFLEMAHVMFGGGTGFGKVWRDVMEASANLLSGAAGTEGQVRQLTYDRWLAGTLDNTQALTTAIYEGAQQVAEAIYESFNALPRYAEGGIVGRPQMAFLGERGPEAVIPMRNLLRMPQAPRGSELVSPGQGMGADARILPYRGSSGEQGGASWSNSGAGGTPKSSVGADMAAGRLQREMASSLRSIADFSGSTARTNQSMARAERIRVLQEKRR